MEVYFSGLIQAQDFVGRACRGGAIPWFLSGTWLTTVPRLQPRPTWLQHGCSPICVPGHRMEERRRSSHMEGFWKSSCDVAYLLLARI